MIRDFNQLRRGPFDLLVIGGGIYGAWTALDASLRGLKVALVDKGDFGGGTSSQSTKLIHGGLRYLEQLRLDLVHSALEERRQLTLIAPHRVKPLRFIIPLYQEDSVGPLKLRTGLWLYDLMAGRGQPVAAHTRLDRGQLLSHCDLLDPQQIRGGFTYGDCQTDDFRLVLDIIEGAQHTGAVAVHYAKVVGLRTTAKRVTGAVVQDLLTGTSLAIDATVVINAAGPWVPLIGDIQQLNKQVRYSKGVHLILPALPTQEALLLMTRDDHRIVFVIPWYGRSLLGTTDSEYHGHPDQVAVEPQDIDYLLAEANRHLIGVRWQRSDVIGAFAGLRTLQNDPHNALSQVTREWSILEPRPGLLVSIGGKFTTARRDAAQLVERCLHLLKRPSGECTPTTGYTLPSTPRSDFALWHRNITTRSDRAGLDAVQIATMISRFGTAAEGVLGLIEESPALANRIDADLPFCWAEIIWSLRREVVIHLEDLLRRRVPLTILSRPNRAIARQVAELAAMELGWSTADILVEVEQVMENWKLPA